MLKDNNRRVFFVKIITWIHERWDNIFMNSAMKTFEK